MVRLCRLFHTARHLKLKQIVYRLYYRLVKIRLTESVTYSQKVWPSTGFAPGPLPSSMPTADSFEFLGEQGFLRDKNAWNDPRKSKLWLYNLHYLDELNAIGAAFRVEAHKHLIHRWIAENSLLEGNGWEPYPLSLRIVNWVKWFSRQKTIEPAWLNSLGLQAQALYKQLEFHILGNHLWANAKALVFVGAFLEGGEPQQWLQKGLKLLDQELKEQFLPDGAHFELSPMYHSILMGDLCDLIRLAEFSGLHELQKRIPGWREVLNHGLFWLENMSHPDGQIAFFNDAAFGVAPDLETIKTCSVSHLDLSSKKGAFSLVPPFLKGGIGGILTNVGGEKEEHKVVLKSLQESGYYRIGLPDDCMAILDIARIGPDYLPGHGHADTLSFELSLFGKRVFVNSGTSMYGENEERLRQRGTAAHNTVIINDENSSEVWGGFRVARRAYPGKPVITKGDEFISIAANHDGYKRLSGKPIHQRSWSFTGRTLVIRDTVKGNFKKAQARFHLHPDIQIETANSSECYVVLLVANEKKVYFSVSGTNSVMLEKSTWHPKFGVSIPNVCIVIPFKQDELMTRIKWGSEV